MFSGNLLSGTLFGGGLRVLFVPCSTPRSPGITRINRIRLVFLGLGEWCRGSGDRLGRTGMGALLLVRTRCGSSLSGLILLQFALYCITNGDAGGSVSFPVRFNVSGGLRLRQLICGGGVGSALTLKICGLRQGRLAANRLGVPGRVLGDLGHLRPARGLTSWLGVRCRSGASLLVLGISCVLLSLLGGCALGSFTLGGLLRRLLSHELLAGGPAGSRLGHVLGHTRHSLPTVKTV